MDDSQANRQAQVDIFLKQPALFALMGGVVGGTMVTGRL